DVEEEVEGEEVVFAEAPPPAAAHVAERVGDEEGQRPDPLGGQLGARAQPVAGQVFLAELLARFGDRGRARLTEQVVPELTSALPGGAPRRLDLCRRARIRLSDRVGGKNGPTEGADREVDRRPHGK